MHLTTENTLQRLTMNKPFRKGASEAEMAARMALRKTTAALAASVVKAEEIKGVRA